ncbi:MAG: hypothetical protein JHC87_00670, partial [Thermoleophilaceae bacterium]|nr:hypothetical protein [Thermoleophilaceae bacterium]
MYKRIRFALLILTLCALFVPSAALAFPDADGDGFDDVTQDLCLGDSAHGETACSGILLGANLTAPKDGSSTSVGIASVFYPTAIPGGTLSPLVNSVIVRWRIKNGNPVGAEYRLRVVKVLPLDTVQGIKTGPVLLGATGIDTIVRSGDTHVPIAPGETIGLQIPAGTDFFFRSTLGANFDENDTDLPDGGTPGGVNLAWADQVMMFSADIEPDADGDTYGDITQDLCTTDATRHSACADVVGPTVS